MIRYGASIAALGVCCISMAQRPAILDAVTFYDEPQTLYLPSRDIGRALDWRVELGKDRQSVYLNGKQVRTMVRRLADGTTLLSLAELKRRGLAVAYDAGRRMSKVRIKNRSFWARKGRKRVVINKSHMQLRAWQGQRVVLASPVTLGIEGYDTPTGIFEAQGYRSQMHKSKLYRNAPMPWAVHIVGNIFVHGWENVEPGRGSHGCIRLPLTGGNPSRFFFYWIEKGTPVSVLGKWPRGAKG